MSLTVTHDENGSANEAEANREVWNDNIQVMQLFNSSHVVHFT